MCQHLMQKLKTRVIKKDVNPVWNEDLTLSITDSNLPIHLVSALFTDLMYENDNWMNNNI